jgi:hypothetical protein
MKACEVPELKIFAEFEPIKSGHIFDDMPLYSTVAFPIENGKLAECEHSGFRLFKIAVRMSGEQQGFEKKLSFKETNLQRHQSLGQFPRNTAFAATEIRFSVYTVEVVGGIEVESAINLTEHEEMQILRSIDWYVNNNQHGKSSEQSPSFFNGPIVEYQSSRRLKLPLMFSPDFETNIVVRVLNDLRIDSHVGVSNAKLCVSCHLDGYTINY